MERVQYLFPFKTCPHRVTPSPSLQGTARALALADYLPPKLRPKPHIAPVYREIGTLPKNGGGVEF